MQTDATEVVANNNQTAVAAAPNAASRKCSGLFSATLAQIAKPPTPLQGGVLPLRVRLLKEVFSALVSLESEPVWGAKLRPVSTDRRVNGKLSLIIHMRNQRHQGTGICVCLVTSECPGLRPFFITCFP